MKTAISLSQEIVEAASRITVEDRMISELLCKQPDIAWMTAPNAAALWHNDVFYDYTGKTPESMRDWAWQDFLPDEEIPRVAGSFYQALDSEQPWEALYPIRSLKGDYRQYLVRGAPVRSSKGGVLYFIGNSTDVTDYIRPEKLLLPRRRR